MSDAVCQMLADKYYGGNVEAYKRERKFGIRTTISWADIETSSKCSSAYENHALYWIKTCLGYVPNDHVYLPHLAFIQTIIEAYNQETISQDQFIDDLTFHAKRIRNDDIKKGGWLKKEKHTQSDFDHYNSYLSVYKNLARDRLSRFLGYEPEIKYSLEAEILLRHLFEMDEYSSGTPFTDTDFKAATITQYKEVFLLQGEERADACFLLGLMKEV